jgi:putative membrane protein
MEVPVINRLLSTASLMAALFASSLALAADSDSQTFIKKAIEGNFAEVALGKLAREKGASDRVRQFGQTLETDHSQANQKAMQAASSLGVPPPTQPSAEQQATYTKLSSQSGGNFDRDFSAAMVTDHQKDIAEYQTASKASDAAGQYAAQTLPTLQKHLSMAQALASNTDATTTATSSPSNGTNASPPLPGANSFTEAQARSRIEKAGFASVSGLKKDDQGIWRGQATKDGKPVAVSLDYKGNVVAQ